MKRSLFSVILFSSLSIHIIAQNVIPNAGFETWKNQGSYEDPEKWGTVNAQTVILGIKTVVKATTTDVHSGTFAIKLITKFIGPPFNQKIPGLSATGTINTTTNAIDGGFSYNLRPEKISGWYKYAPAGKDTASVSVTLSKWDVNTGQRIVIGTASFMDTATVNTYTSFSASINYVSSLAPDTAIIILLSSQQTSGVLNSTLIVDDLSLDMATGIQQAENNSEIVIYPNPASAILSVSKVYAIGTKLILLDSKGGKVSENRLCSFYDSIDISSLEEGLYLYQLLDADEQLIKSGKLIINSNE